MTSQVILRPWQRQDAQALTAIANNKKIWNQVRDRFPSPYTMVDALQWIAFCEKQQPLQQFCIAVGTQVVGSIGWISQEDVARKSAEIGYFIGESYWGKGFATAAINALTQHLESEGQLVRLFAHTFAHNKASMRVLQKAGFYLESIRRKAAYKNGEILDDYVWVKLIHH